MAIKNGIYSFLNAATAITALTSNRIYPNSNVPQDFTLPFISYRRVSADRDHEAKGSSVRCSIGKSRDRIEFSCIAETPDGAETLGDTLRKAIDGYIGLMGTNTVQACSLIGDRDIYDPETDLYIRSMDFRIAYLEATT